MWYEKLVEALISGLRVGSVYALIALGYTMVYGILKLINFAHGEFIMIGAFVSLWVSLAIGATWFSMIICAIAAMLVCVAVAVFTEKVAYKPLRNMSRITSLIKAIGMSYLIQNIFNLISAGKPQNPPKFIAFEMVQLFPGNSPKIDLSMTIFTVVVALIAMVALMIFINYTKTGKAMKAVSENQEAAKLMGIKVDKTISITFAIGAILAALSAMFYCLKTSVYFNASLGSVTIGIKPFVAAVVGGIGSFPGAVIGGYIIGIVEQIVGVTFLASYRDVFVFGILILVLIIKPTGFFGKNTEQKA